MGALLATILNLGEVENCRRVNSEADNVLFLNYWDPLIFLPLMSESAFFRQ
jgi:hypothetical protein